MLIERANQTLRRLRPDPAPRPSRAFRCAVAAAGLVSLVYLACVALRAGGFAASITVDDVGPLIAAGLAAILCLRTARGHAGRPRAGWALFGSAAASWAIGETLWTWFEVIRGIPAPFPSAADAAFLLSVPLTIAGLLCFYAPPLGITSRLRTVLDALIIAASTLLVSWLTVLESVFRGAGGGLLARSISLAYPVGDVITLSVLLVVARRRPAGPRLPLGWLAAAVLALSISDSAFTYFSPSPNLFPGWGVEGEWLALFE